MDDLILTFNNEQIKVYESLLSKNDIELSFDFSLNNFTEITIPSFEYEISCIINEAHRLLKLKKTNSVFTSDLSQDEIKKLIPIYYDVIKNIEYHKNNMGNCTWNLSCELDKSNSIHSSIIKRYSDFLPYKAALYDRKEYSSKISQIDEEFKKSIEKSNNYKKKILSSFNMVLNLCKIINEFYAKNSIATDEPKFIKFKTQNLFNSVEAFIEQINAVTKQKEM